jgi:hypothetical protein
MPMDDASTVEAGNHFASWAAKQVKELYPTKEKNSSPLLAVSST